MIITSFPARPIELEGALTRDCPSHLSLLHTIIPCHISVKLVTNRSIFENAKLRFREAGALGMENPTSEDRRRCLQILHTRVTVTNGLAVITCPLGGKPSKYDLFGLGDPFGLT